MRSTHGMRRMLAAACTAAAALFGCGSPEQGEEGGGPPASSGCPEADRIAGACAGVPQADICDGVVCADGVACESTVTAADDAALAAALAGAQQKKGTCVALEPGTYGAVALPAGTALLGRGAAHVAVQGVVVAAGQGSVVRGLSVGAGGIRLEGATAVRIEAVRVTASMAEGVWLGAGASAEMASCTVAGSHGPALFLEDGAELEVATTLIEGALGPGVWAECSAGCGCAAPPSISLEKSFVRDNALAGVGLVAAKASLRDVAVTGTRPREKDLQGGGGVAAIACSALAMAGVRVSDNDYFGVLVHESKGALGGTEDADAVEVVGNGFMGVWIQDVGDQGGGAAVTLQRVGVRGNAVVGIGMDGASAGIIIQGSEVRKTAALTAPSLDGSVLGSASIGDGLFWQGGVEAQIDGLSLGGSARNSVLVNGEVAAGSSVSKLGLVEGDEERGIIIQGFPAGGTTPAGLDAVAKVKMDPAALFPVAAPPAAPAAGP